jgi:outer membrane biosynthesis protein TonB
MPRVRCRSLLALVSALVLGNASAQPASAGSASTPQASQASEQASKVQAVARSSLAVCVRKPPEYPIAARRLGLQGRTMVLFVVSAEGVPEEPRLLRSSGHAVLDQAAVKHLGSCIKAFVEKSSERLPSGQYALPMEWRLE